MLSPQSDYLQSGLTIVVVGASGDLAKKKTFPSLLDLFAKDLLPSNTLIWGYARSHMTHAELRQQLKPHLLKRADKIIVDSFLSQCHYKRGNSYGDEEAWRLLSRSIETHEARHHLPTCLHHNRLFYMAIPPNVFAETGLAIKRTALQLPNMGWSRLVIEKPFGRDLESCRMLLATLGSHFQEDQIYRIDHYLGKEMVQNIIPWRFGNSMFEPMWNRNHIRSVHIAFKEPFGTEGRGGYFDNYGIIRDILQNHLLQVLVLLTMDAPVVADDANAGDRVRDAKYKVLRSILEIELNDCLLGQYEGYSDDKTITNKDSNCPTYAAIRCFVHTPRWEGVPFILEAGKAVNEHLCQVCIRFKGTPSYLANRRFPCNTLVMRLQPNPTIFITTNIKTPGLSSVPMSAPMILQYDTHNNPDAYTRLVLDALRGQQASFVRADELERSWEIFTPLLHRIERENIRPHQYTYGSSGPTQRDRFLLQAEIASPMPQSAL
jgi:glucose-6-phosphate 1-dehydrogenase